jgi:hypothetical protein
MKNATATSQGRSRLLTPDGVDEGGEAVMELTRLKTAGCFVRNQAGGSMIPDKGRDFLNRALGIAGWSRLSPVM